MKKLLFAFIFFIFCAIDAKAYVIPKLYIDGNIENMNSKSDIRKVKISYESEDLTFSSYATLKIQGNWSLRYDKKNYTIKERRKGDAPICFADPDYSIRKLGWAAEKDLGDICSDSYNYIIKEYIDNNDEEEYE